MQIVPDQQNGRLTAILILFIILIAVYMLGFHWFIKRHIAYADELSGLREQLGRYEAIAAQREPLQQQLAEIRSSRDDADLFLTESNFNEAAAALSERLGQMVSTQADESCQIVSRQPVRPRIEERFERVTVNVRMRCHGEDMVNILYRLESEVPMVIVDDLNVLRPQSRGRRNNDGPAPVQPLDVRFNMSGYLKS